MNNQFLNHLASITPQGRDKDTGLFVSAKSITEKAVLKKAKVKSKIAGKDSPAEKKKASGWTMVDGAWMPPEKNPAVMEHKVGLSGFDAIDQVIAEGIEIYGEKGMVAILEDFADTGEISEELSGLLDESLLRKISQRGVGSLFGKKDAVAAVGKRIDDKRKTTRGGSNDANVVSAHLNAQRRLGNI